mmetsp:Transcript_3632/g.13277  ORF Transcript_3632/g.13277 Transcript_3632/m.13277 type:complete len:309 (-) Transcript_3632:229-1155(-)
MQADCAWCVLVSCGQRHRRSVNIALTAPSQVEHVDRVRRHRRHGQRLLVEHVRQLPAQPRHGLAQAHLAADVSLQLDEAAAQLRVAPRQQHHLRELRVDDEPRPVDHLPERRHLGLGRRAVPRLALALALAVAAVAARAAARRAGDVEEVVGVLAQQAVERHEQHRHLGGAQVVQRALHEDVVARRAHEQRHKVLDGDGARRLLRRRRGVVVRGALELVLREGGERRRVGAAGDEAQDGDERGLGEVGHAPHALLEQRDLRVRHEHRQQRRVRRRRHAARAQQPPQRRPQRQVDVAQAPRHDGLHLGL